MNQNDIIELRPHHGLCILHYIGKGYSEDFTQNMDKIVKKLSDNPNQLLKLKIHTDVLCSKCPFNKGSICESNQKVIEIDNNCLKQCELDEGTIITWSNYKKLLKNNVISLGKITSVCKDCEWIELCKNL